MRKHNNKPPRCAVCAAASFRRKRMRAARRSASFRTGSQAEHALECLRFEPLEEEERRERQDVLESQVGEERQALRRALMRQLLHEATRRPPARPSAISTRLAAVLCAHRRALPPTGSRKRL